MEEQKTEEHAIAPKRRTIKSGEREKERKRKWDNERKEKNTENSNQCERNGAWKMSDEEDTSGLLWWEKRHLEISQVKKRESFLAFFSRHVENHFADGHDSRFIDCSHSKTNGNISKTDTFSFQIQCKGWQSQTNAQNELKHKSRTKCSQNGIFFQLKLDLFACKIMNLQGEF